MVNIAIIYHSGYGHTKVIAESIKTGIESGGATCKEYKVEDFTDAKCPLWQELLDYDAMVFGSPTYMGSASAAFKTFADLSSAQWFAQKWKNKFAAGFTISGTYSGDKYGTLTQFVTLACQHSMIWISQGIMPTGKSDEDINRLGSWIGLMGQADHDEPEKTPPIGDHKTAEMFGKRIAEIVSSCKPKSS